MPEKYRQAAYFRSALTTQCRSRLFRPVMMLPPGCRKRHFLRAQKSCCCMSTRWHMSRSLKKMTPTVHMQEVGRKASQQDAATRAQPSATGVGIAIDIDFAVAESPPGYASAQSQSRHSRKSSTYHVMSIFMQRVTSIQPRLCFSSQPAMC